MKTSVTNRMKVGLMVLAVQLGFAASVYAGGGSLLRLPINGITENNKEQCKQLFEKKFPEVLIDSRYSSVRMIKDGSGYMVQLRPERGRVTLKEIENALKDSPFSIKRDHLVYYSLARFQLGEIENAEKHVKAIAKLSEKNLQTNHWKDENGKVWMTFRDPSRNSGRSFSEYEKKLLFSHKSLTKYLADNKIDLLAVSWGYHHGDQSKTYTEAWRGEPFGARLVSSIDK